jgi:hypothetical protein
MPISFHQAIKKDQKKVKEVITYAWKVNNLDKLLGRLLKLKLKEKKKKLYKIWKHSKRLPDN